MQIRGILPETTIDWPGKFAIEVFLGGCNFQCPYCHVPDLVKSNGNGKTYSFDSFYKLLDAERRRGWKDGVVISGGEPTIHKELPEFIDEIKKRGFPVKIYTNGSNPDMLEKIIDKLDAVSMDAKGTLEIYNLYVGTDVDSERIRRSSEIIRENLKDYEFRTTCIPVFTNDTIIRMMAAWLEGSKKLVLQNFRPGTCLDPRYNDHSQFTKEGMDVLKRTADRYFNKVEVLYNLDDDSGSD